ncbi:MAG TPA: NAD(P)-binding protein [Syntrophorhabdales bacterium]|nr:NAD(P)-binding protein [Syntrophorhabdales bacterium]
MAAILNVTINGNKYSANPGQTILDVAREHQIDDIPTLCHDPKLPPYGSCYLCVVEVEGLEKLIPSCASPVADGMKIHTDNARIRQSRKTALELLLSNHYADCLGPCTQTCPAGVDVQGYIALMAAGRYREAVKLIKEKNPLPLVCGRVCVRECETACRRNMVDDPVGIDYLKRYAADIDITDPWTPVPQPSTGKKVAIVGGGPAGLTCAYYLALDGHAPTIFEQSPALGGMLRYGIPEYRLPKQMLDREIKLITDLGVVVKTNTTLGKNVTIDSLKAEGFDAIFVAIGAQKAKGMGLDGETEIPGVIGGADFLRQMQAPRDEEKPKVFGRVVVVGGGNTAIDAARTSLRLGAAKVTILYRRTRKEMPANEMEIEAAIDEGIEMVFLSAPTGIVTKDGRLRGLQCIRMELGEPDASGRRSPVPVKDSEYLLECDFVVSAIGQDIELGMITAGGQLKTTWSKAIQTDKSTFETSIPGVFAGGDAITGPAVAIDAIAHGRMAANAIDQYIREGKARVPGVGFVSRKESFGNLVESDFAQYPKVAKEKMPELPVAERIRTLAEVEVGFTDTQAKNEASRCLECGCSAYFDCALRKYATDFGVDLTRFVGDVRKYKVDRDHPFIALDPNKCISCGRCVRTCSEILKISALGFVYRGFKSVVKPSMEKKLLQTNCISCGNCISACPTGAITEKVPFAKPGPWTHQEIESICSFCSLGCNLKYKVFHDHIFSIGSTNGTSHNKGYLCPKGRFGYRYMLDDSRLLKPVIRKKGKFKEVGWDQALDYAANRIKAIIETHGPEAVALFGSPRMTNEELYLLQKLARVGLKTNNLGSFANLLNGVEQDALDDMFGITTSTATTDDLATADLILVVNADLSEESLIAELKIKAAQRNGARLVTVASSEIELNKFADVWIDAKRGTVTALIQGMSNAVIGKGLADTQYIGKRTDGYEAFKESIAGLDLGGVSELTGVNKERLTKLYDLVARPDQSIVVVYNIDSLWEKSRNDLKAIGNFMMLTGRIGKPGNGIILLRDYSNSQGLLDMGVDSRYLPGHISPENAKEIKNLSSLWGVDLSTVFTPVNLKEQLEGDKIKALLIFGEDPLAAPQNVRLTGGVEFLLVFDHFMTATAMEADVVLPASLPIETEGSLTACDRRVQKTGKLFEPRNGMETWQAISKLADKLGSPFAYTSVKDIANEIRAAVPYYREMNGGPFWGEPFLRTAFMTANGKGRFSLLPVNLSPYSVDKKQYISSENYFHQNIKGRLMK